MRQRPCSAVTPRVAKVTYMGQGVSSRDGALSGGWHSDVCDVHPDGLLVADEQGFIVYVNKRAAVIIGTPSSELLGQDIRTALPLQENDGRSWWACTDPWKGLAIRSGHREKLLIIPGRTEVLVTASYVRPGRSMPVTQVVVALRDAEARRRAEANNSALISTIAHELRSPLTSVKGFSSTLLRRWDRFTDDQKRLMLQTIEADADRVTRLITELLDISRIDSGRLQVRKQPVDVTAAINRHIERFVASGYDRARFALSNGHDVVLPEVWADPDRLDQILAKPDGECRAPRGGHRQHVRCANRTRGRRGRCRHHQRRGRGHLARAVPHDLHPLLAWAHPRRHRLGPVRRTRTR